MTPEEILGDRVSGCDGHHSMGGCLRCYLLPRIEKALAEERERSASVVEAYARELSPNNFKGRDWLFMAAGRVRQSGVRQK